MVEELLNLISRKLDVLLFLHKYKDKNGYEFFRDKEREFRESKDAMGVMIKESVAETRKLSNYRELLKEALFYYKFRKGEEVKKGVPFEYEGKWFLIEESFKDGR